MLTLLALAAAAAVQTPPMVTAQQTVPVTTPEALSAPSEQQTEALSRSTAPTEPSAASMADTLPAAAPPASKLTFGAAIRGRYDLRLNDVNAGGRRRTSNHLSYDAVILTVDYDSPTIFAAGQYRFFGGSFIYNRANGYRNYPGEVNFPVYGYVGAKLSPKDKVAFGLQSVPFDERWWGSAFFDSMAFAFGMEEVYNVGVNYTHTSSDVAIDAAFFPTTAPSVMGISSDSARFSVNMVKGDSYVPSASHNAERNMLVGRVQYKLPPWGDTKLTLIGSAWFSTIHNFDTHEDGKRRSLALSLRGERGPWHAKILAARQNISPRNPDQNDFISVGNYDSSFNIASKGVMLFGEVGHYLDTGELPFKLHLYANYSRFLKDKAAFADSERLTIGGFWTDKKSGRIRVWTDLMIGRNDPYVGAGQFLTGGAQGGDNKIKTALLVVFGYYF